MFWIRAHHYKGQWEGVGPWKSRVFWALWNGIEPIGECYLGLGPKKLERLPSDLAVCPIFVSLQCLFVQYFTAVLKNYIILMIWVGRTGRCFIAVNNDSVSTALTFIKVIYDHKVEGGGRVTCDPVWSQIQRTRIVFLTGHALLKSSILLVSLLILSCCHRPLRFCHSLANYASL